MTRKQSAKTEPTNFSAFRIKERYFKNATGIPTTTTPIHIKDNQFQFKDFPGILLLRNHLSIENQQYLVEKCLCSWTRPPNLSNLDAHFEIPSIGLYNALQQDSELSCQPRNVKETIQVGDLKIDPPTDAMAAKKPKRAQDLMSRLRWTTLGYQYNWTDKVYFFDRSPPFPSDCDAFIRDIVKHVQEYTNYSHNNWKSEAGIINFYHAGDSLTAHQDKSEVNQDAPLVSISLGCDAIFLFGTADRNDEPISILLKSGDVVVLYGPGRRCFHGVPRVFAGTSPDFFTQEFMKDTRININVRQVI